jgi:hypothetical protein
MLDIFGMGKVDARDTIQEMMCGATRGLIEAYQYELSQKDDEIKRLKDQLQEQEDWKTRYEELSNVLDFKKENKENKLKKKKN